MKVQGLMTNFEQLRHVLKTYIRRLRDIIAVMFETVKCSTLPFSIEITEE